MAHQAMGVWEILFAGVFDLLKTGLLLFVLLTWVLPAVGRMGSKMFGGGWGAPDGDLPLLSPKRVWCKHRVAWYGPGTHGLYALWCNACGKKVNRK